MKPPKRKPEAAGSPSSRLGDADDGDLSMSRRSHTDSFASPSSSIVLSTPDSGNAEGNLHVRSQRSQSASSPTHQTYVSTGNGRNQNFLRNFVSGLIQRSGRRSGGDVGAASGRNSSVARPPAPNASVTADSVDPFVDGGDNGSYTGDGGGCGLDLHELVPVLVFCIVCGILASVAIAFVFYSSWCLICPYTTGIVGGLAFATINRHRFERTRRIDSHIALETARVRENLRAHHLAWYLCWMATPLALVTTCYSVDDHVALMLGFGKFPGFASSKLRRVVGLVAWGSLMMYALRSPEALLVVLGAVALVILTAGWRCADGRMPSLIRGTLLWTFAVLMIALMARLMWSEVIELRETGKWAVDSLRDMGINAPDVAQNGLQYVSNYLLTENTTIALMDIADALPKSTNATLFERGTEMLRDTQRLTEVAFNLTQLEISDALKDSAKSVLVTAFNVLATFFAFVLTLIYEVTLFFTVLAFVQSQKHTVVFHANYLFRSWFESEAEAQEKALATEQRILTVIDQLAMSYVHIIFWNFSTTLIAFACCGVKFGFLSAMWATFFSSFPYGAPVIVPHLIGIGWALQAKDFERAATFATVTVLLHFYGGRIQFYKMKEKPSHHRKHKDTGKQAPPPPATQGQGFMDPGIVAISVVLGYGAFGAKGILLGPLLPVGIQLALQGDEPSGASSPGAASPIAGPTPSAKVTRGRKFTVTQRVAEHPKAQ